MHLKTQALSTIGMASLAMSAIVPRGDNIVHGSNANASNAYWQVGLGSNGMFRCGGAIISSNQIVTAAHCLDGNLPTESLRIQSGSPQLDYHGQVHAVQSYTIHPEYDSQTLVNDVAVIQIADQFSWDPYTYPIEMADGDPAGGTLAIVAGWGLTEGQGGGSRSLKIVEVPVVDHEECVRDYTEVRSRFSIQPGMLCAGYQSGGLGTCFGDSGGALVDKTTRKMIGIVSWLDGCARLDKPGVFASVSFFRDWIRGTSGV